jgi:hypothetical protein
MAENKISFSQFHMWKSCPRRWKLKYADNIRKEEPSVSALFGTAMHEVLQEYVTEMYSSSVSKANELNLNEMLRNKIKKQYKDLLVENNNVHFSNTSELSEYYEDGVEILNFFKKNREAIFPKKDYELVGIEMPIDRIASEHNKNIKIVGFLDVVIKDTSLNKYYIYDFKTSTKGWGKYQKNDKVKISQLILYKKYFAEQYQCDLSSIDIEYIILKRKINQDAEYASMKQRIQRFRPPSGTLKVKQISNEINKFVTTVFNEDGSYNLNIIYPSVAGFNNSNCRFCEFKDDQHLCNKNERIS